MTKTAKNGNFICPCAHKLRRYHWSPARRNSRACTPWYHYISRVQIGPAWLKWFSRPPHLSDLARSNSSHLVVNSPTTILSRGVFIFAARKIKIETKNILFKKIPKPRTYWTEVTRFLCGDRFGNFWNNFDQIWPTGWA